VLPDFASGGKKRRNDRANRYQHEPGDQKGYQAPAMGSAVAWGWRAEKNLSCTLTIRCPRPRPRPHSVKRFYLHPIIIPVIWLLVAGAIHQFYRLRLQFSGFVHIYRILFETAPRGYGRISLDFGVYWVFHVYVGKKVLRFFRG
jgi:hypothetical protein